MILLTVGTQLPFDRLVIAADEWCRLSGRNDIIGQVGALGPKNHRPTRFQWSEFFTPQCLDEVCREAEVVIAHAGMGSIISALRHARPIVIMPRRASLGEHRNDHQVATAARFADRSGVYVASEGIQLPETIDHALRHADAGNGALAPYAEPALLDAIRAFIQVEAARARKFGNQV